MRLELTTAAIAQAMHDPGTYWLEVPTGLRLDRWLRRCHEAAARSGNRVTVRVSPAADDTTWTLTFRVTRRPPPPP